MLIHPLMQIFFLLNTNLNAAVNREMDLTLALPSMGYFQ